MKSNIFKASVAAVFALVFFFGLGAVTTAAQDDFGRAETFVGFMHKRSGGDGFNGINASGVYNFHKFAGAKFDVSWSKGPDTLIGERVSDATFMGGIQFKDNREEGSVVKPFGHVLFGANRQSISLAGETGFSMAVGGGIDVKVRDNFSIRLIQADYQPVWVDGGRVNQGRFSFGVVFH